jgi:hypothetical protein
MMPPERELDVHVDQHTDLAGGIAAAVFDRPRPRATYRYLLTRIWDPTVPPAVWIMLNPSTAGADHDDPTVRRITGFARSWGRGGVIVVNLFALCATDPARLRTHRDPVGQHNASFVDRATTMSDLTVAAWGAGGSLADRGPAMARALHARGIALKALRLTSTGQPGHPLYVPANTPLTDYLPA